MDRLLCDMSWNCTESVAMYTLHTYWVPTAHRAHAKLQCDGQYCFGMIQSQYRQMNKSNNGDRRTCVKLSRELFNKNKLMRTHSHIHSAYDVVLCGVCTVVHVAAGKSSAQNSLAYSLVIRVVKIDPVLNVTRTPKQTTTWPLSSIFFAYDNAQPFLWLLFICSLFYSLVNTSLRFSSIPALLLLLLAVFFFQFRSCFHVHVHYCVFDTFLIVIVTALPIPSLPYQATVAVGFGCAKTPSVYCYCWFYSSSSETQSNKRIFCIEIRTKPND